MERPWPQTSSIILFGGTFDPPHLGHLMCIETVLEAVPQGHILVMPTPSPPPLDARSPSKKAAADYTHRLAMCELAFEAIPSVTVSSLESTLPAPQYTYRTLEAISRLLPQEPPSRIAMIVGEDQFWGLGSWKNPALILSKVQLIVVGRPAPAGGNVSPPAHSKKQLSIQSAHRHIQEILEGTQSLELHPPLAPLAPLLLNQRASDISSSEIRGTILGGEPIPPNWIQDSVMTYIQDHKLYGVVENSWNTSK